MDKKKKNRQQLGETTLAEWALREELLDLHGDTHDTLSRLSAASHRAEAE